MSAVRKANNIEICDQTILSSVCLFRPRRDDFRLPAVWGQFKVDVMKNTRDTQMPLALAYETWLLGYWHERVTFLKSQLDFNQ